MFLKEFNTMITFILILCAISQETMVQTATKKAQDILPATIFWRNTGMIILDSDLILTCSTHGRDTEHRPVHVYLCKNGDAVEMIKSTKELIIFTLKSVNTQQNGNYSCVFSETYHELQKVRGKGDNSISIQVIDRILPADILPKGSRTVKQGEIVEFKCTILDPRIQTKYVKTLVHSYLCKNGNALQMQ
ncbi:hypothetical protein UPYG_G00083280, partial [Umbra pygmaea]